MAAKIDRVPTGILGLDELIEGGLPRGSCTLISGSAGTGKTTLTVQFLYNGALKFNEPGIIVLLNERAEKLRTYMLRFGWDLDALEREGKIAIIETSPIVIKERQEDRVPGRGRSEVGIPAKSGMFDDILPFSTDTIGNMIDQKIKETGATRLIFDSLSDLMMRHPTSFGVRLDLLWLVRFLDSRNLTSLLISEVSREGETDRFGVESFLVGGLIVLRNITIRDETVNVFEVVKMRGTEHSRKRIAYKITSSGLTFYPSLRFA